MSEYNSDIRKFLEFLRNEEICNTQEDIDYSVLTESIEATDTGLLSDVRSASDKLNSYYIIDGSFDYKSGFQAGLMFAIEILENIIEKHGE